jgi:hypothetical protein
MIVMRNWERLFVDSFASEDPMSTATEFLNSCVGVMGDCAEK